MAYSRPPLLSSLQLQSSGSRVALAKLIMRTVQSARGLWGPGHQLKLVDDDLVGLALLDLLQGGQLLAQEGDALLGELELLVVDRGLALGAKTGGEGGGGSALERCRAASHGGGGGLKVGAGLGGGPFEGLVVDQA